MLSAIFTGLAIAFVLVVVYCFFTLLDFLLDFTEKE